MPSPRKIYLNNTVLFVTTTVQEGLMFPPNPYIKLILLGILGRAQKLYPVRVCHFLFEATHVHIILVVDNPKYVEDFMKYFKAESAHAVNRLLGRTGQTLWSKGFDSPPLLTSTDVIKKIIYTYQNPIRDNLSETLEEYPGLNSWQMFLEGESMVKCPWIRREAIGKLAKKRMSLKEAQAIAHKLKNNAIEYNSFVISPDAWMDCFDITDLEERREINQGIIERIRELEIEYSKERKKEKERVLPVLKQILQPPGSPHTGEKKGRRSLFICSNRELRFGFLSFIKEKITKACEVFQRWKEGDYSIPFPAGLCPPSMPKIIEMHTRVALEW